MIPPNNDEPETATEEKSSDPDSLETVVKHSSIYSLVPLFQRASAILLVPLYTDALIEAQWGVLEIAELFIVATTQLIGVNLVTGMTRFYFERDDEKGRNEVVTTATITLGVMASLVAALAVLFRGSIVPLLFDANDPGIDGSALPRYLAMTAVTIPFALATRCGVEYLQIHKRSKVSASIQLAKLIVELSLKIYFLVVLEWGIFGFLLSMLVGEMLTSIGLTGVLLLRLGPKWRWTVLRPMLAYALPLIPVGLCQLGLHQADKLLLRSLGPEGLVMAWIGIYGLGYKLAYLANAVLLTSFLQIWYPFVFGIDDAMKRARTVAYVGTYAMLAMTAATLGLILFGREGIHLLASKPGYYNATKVVPWVACGYVFWSLYAVSQMPLYVAKRTRPIMWINMVALAGNIGLNIVLIPRYGYVGAALATLFTFMGLSLMGVLASRLEAKVPFEVGRILRTLAVLLAGVTFTVGVDTWLPDGDWIEMGLGAVLKGVAGIGLLFLLWRWVLDGEERVQARAWVLQRIGR